MNPVALIALLHAPVSASEVDMSGEWLGALLPPRPDPPEEGPRPWVSGREVWLETSGDAVRVRARWSIEAVEPGWVDLPLVDSSVRLDASTLSGRPVSLKSLNDGRRHYTAWVDGPGELRIEGEIVGDLRRGLTLALLPAPVGTVHVVTDDPVVAVTTGAEEVPFLEGRFWTGATSLSVATTKEKPAVRTGQLALGSVGLGVTVTDDVVRVGGRARWRIVRGELTSVSFRAPGAGADLEVTGPQVARFDREGEVIRVALREPQRSAVDLEVSWTTPIPDRDQVEVAVPRLEPVGVFRTEASLQIARDGDREIVPRLGGWEALPAAALPAIARDLVLGTPTSAWKVTDGGPRTLELLRFEPVAGPATIVDVAAYDGALSVDGRLLMRAHYTVRNDRAAFLEVRIPDGTRVVGARVNGEPATVSREGDTWRVPLLKSVETVQGLLNFPVDLLLLSDGDGFEKRDERRLRLPRLSAEVAVTRVELSLPVGWTNRLELGEAQTVGEFDEGEGITYGFAVGDTNIAKADALFQDALDAWMGNDFDSAQEALDDLKGLGASNENIDRLSSNLNLVLGDDEEDASGQAGAMQRRVKEQAQARARVDLIEQEKLLDEADEAYFSGDYDRAERSWKRALDIGSNLERIEQEESVEESAKNAYVLGKLKDVEKKKKSKGRNSRSVFEGDALDASQTLEIDFDGVAIDGELVAPDGLVVSGRQSIEVLVEEKAREAASNRAREQSRLEAERAEAEERQRQQAAQLERARREEEARRAEQEQRRAAEESDRRADERRAAEALLRQQQEGRGPGTEEVVIVAGDKTIDVASTTRGEVLTEELLDVIPPQRSYQSAVRQAAGVAVGAAQAGNPNIGGAAADEPPSETNEPVFVLDGAPITDPVTPPFPTKSKPRLRIPFGGAKKEAASPPPPPPPQTASSPAMGAASGFADLPAGPALAPLEVTASSLDVVIPSYGETVRYQHLLLPAEQPLELLLRTKRSKKRD